MNRNTYICIMEKQTNPRLIDVTRLHVLKNVARMLSIPYSSLYLRKLRGEFEVVEISGVEFILEPEDGFKVVKKKKKGSK